MSGAENLSIELDNYPGFYFPGQTVTGRVVIIVTEQPGEKIQYFRISFHGEATLDWATGRIRHRNKQTYFDDTIQLNQRNDGSWVTSLPYGRHTFPFVYNLPAEIPASYNGTSIGIESNITYCVQATARLEGFWKSEMKAQVSLRVERPIDLNLFPWAAKPVVIEDEKYLCCCCCQSGPYSFKLTFNKTGFIIGENIQFLAEFVNNTKADIENAEVWISRTVMFEATDGLIHSEMWEEPLGPKFSIPGVSAGQRVNESFNLNIIRNHSQINSFGCSFMKSIYEFHIRMSIPNGQNLAGKIPIVIGVVPFVIQLGRPD